MPKRPTNPSTSITSNSSKSASSKSLNNPTPWFSNRIKSKKAKRHKQPADCTTETSEQSSLAVDRDNSQLLLVNQDDPAEYATESFYMPLGLAESIDNSQASFLFRGASPNGQDYIASQLAASRNALIRATTARKLEAPVGQSNTAEGRTTARESRLSTYDANVFRSERQAEELDSGTVVAQWRWILVFLVAELFVLICTSSRDSYSGALCSAAIGKVRYAFLEDPFRGLPVRVYQLAYSFKERS